MNGAHQSAARHSIDELGSSPHQRIAATAERWQRVPAQHDAGSKWIVLKELAA